ncbi:hypothetical protein LX32DRAFT_680253 [Colletotrichum zoysiae]|uniref:Uncharacterized protein n=1 Tax=Colletotrichum zoysiae TaxID=1216348 RepID=A0AAD9HPI5_9PEZI|nr:hypothetical protein LX32DRAFT_680253 [Colletotrichum zoysiae]
MESQRRMQTRHAAGIGRRKEDEVCVASVSVWLKSIKLANTRTHTPYLIGVDGGGGRQKGTTNQIAPLASSKSTSNVPAPCRQHQHHHYVKLTNDVKEADSVLAPSWRSIYPPSPVLSGTIFLSVLFALISRFNTMVSPGWLVGLLAQGQRFQLFDESHQGPGGLGWPGNKCNWTWNWNRNSNHSCDWDLFV